MFKLLKVCHVVPSINIEVGGPAVSVPGMVNALNRKGLPAHLVTLDYRRHGPQAAIDPPMLHSRTAGPLCRMLRGFDLLLAGMIKRLEPELIHNHGLWMWPNYVARKAATSLRVPLIISPRGMLEGWSLNHRPWRKWLVGRLFERSNLTSAAGFHATSESELEAIRRAGLTQPVAVIPNGIDDPLADAATRESLTQWLPELAGKRWCVFLGRLHAKKGLDTLVEVWGRLHDQHENWHLVIAGPDLNGYRRELEKQIIDRQLSASVTIAGMVAGQRKNGLLAESDLFVLPTHSENFGVAVGETLAAGTPAIVSKGAPWQALEATQSGWWVDHGEGPLEEAMRVAMALPKDSLRSMGQSGRFHILQHYGWESLAERMAAFYQALLSQRSDQLDFVR